MNRSIFLISLLFAAAPVTSALAQEYGTPPLDFLERKDLPTPQSKPFPMPYAAPDVLYRNKQVVLDFYKVVSDQHAWTKENMDKYFQPDFVQHDPAEPSTSNAFFEFFRGMAGDFAKRQKSGEKAGPPMQMPGKTSNDANNSPVNWMIAEGDIVMVVRHRNWAWAGGPEPVYDGIFVDVWRLKDGKLAEQWCSATPADAQVSRILKARAEGRFPKTPEEGNAAAPAK